MSYTRRERTDLIVVHTSASAYGRDIGWEEINQMHIARGWSSGGYHGYIRLDGRYEPGRPWWAVGAHAYGRNRASVGFCMIGGLDRYGKPANTFTPAQFATLELVVRLAKNAYPRAEVLGHRDLSPDTNGDGVIEKWEWVKECPCFDVRGWWASVLRPSSSQAQEGQLELPLAP